MWPEVRNPSQYILTPTVDGRAGPLQVTNKISISVSTTAIHRSDVGHIQHCSNSKDITTLIRVIPADPEDRLKTHEKLSS